MRILLENSGYSLRNLGDLAMLQVAVKRLREFWPTAEIMAITGDPARMKRLCPSVIPVSLVVGRNRWTEQWNVLGGIHRLMPKSISEEAAVWEQKLRIRYPLSLRGWICARMRRRGVDTDPVNEFLALIDQTDLVVSSGGGYLTDAFGSHAKRVLEMFGFAKTMGKPVMILGQGIGPITSKSLLALARSVLPSVDLIGLREGHGSLKLLESSGVERSHVVITGDDAIEMAYDQRPESLGQCLGVNLRVASYAEVDVEHGGAVRSALRNLKGRYRTTLLGLPVDLDSDAEAARKLLDGIESGREQGGDLDNAIELIRRIGRCRVVLTGSYHAAVFALAQGIPAVCLARSSYYRQKFEGLAGQFISGTRIVYMDDSQFEVAMLTSIDALWSSAEAVRDELLTSAREQIEHGRSAYQQLRDIVRDRGIETCSE